MHKLAHYAPCTSMFLMAMCILATESKPPDIRPMYSFKSAIQNLVLSADGETRVTLVKQLHLYHEQLTRRLWHSENVFQSLHASAGNPECLHDLESIVSGIFRRDKECLLWLDAVGRPPPGLSGGAIEWPGSFELCLNIPEKLQATGVSLSSHYCSVLFKLPFPFKLPVTMHFGINVGICLPKSCNLVEVIGWLNKVLSNSSLQIDEVATYCHSSPDSLPKDSWFYFAIVLASVFGALMLSATMLELGIWFIWNSQNKTDTREPLSTDHWHSTSALVVSNQVDDSGGNGELETPLLIGQSEEVASGNPYMTYSEFRGNFFKSQGKAFTWLGAFSVPYNAQKLCNCSQRPCGSHSINKSQPHALAFLDGIRFITMLWIILGHCLAFSCLVSNNVPTYIEKNARLWTFQALVGATLSVDTFFMMSGLLTVYVTLPRFASVNTLVGQIQFWLTFVLHRLIRLTPLYLLVIVLYTGLFNHLYDGPMYPQRPEMTDSIYCRQHWWVTFLNNFLYEDQTCMAWSWYLSNDFQFTVVLAPIFISLVTWNATAGVLFAILLVISSILSTVGIAYSNGYYPWPLSPESFDTIYIKPYTRWGTYALGLILGWIIHRGYRLPQRVSSEVKLVFTFMSLSLASVCCLWTVYGLADIFSQKVPMWSTGVSALHTAVHRPIFIVGVGIVTYLCANRYASPIRSLLSWSAFRPFARLTYGAYLVHPIVILFLVLGSQSPVMLDNIYLITVFGTVVLISYALSFVLSLAIESPLVNLEKMIFRR
ncbi:hypothetical protein P879_03154 [Paragonimus westermani]|uniref:Nose resistant-to-fluoxetine protein N-terminal domain-containing protein n=1 Tax=Paragonimus westermani TaxID=34504 RepID=A0A8T0DJT9_9TREM|nr:hypothetical protein P879_03154 [Paragonimus westermani]